MCVCAAGKCKGTGVAKTTLLQGAPGQGGSGKADLGQKWQEEAAQGSSAAALPNFEEVYC